MQEANLFLLFIKRLNGLSIPYAVTGSVASIIYGEPRITHDIDIVLLLPKVKIEDFLNAFSKESFYAPPIEVIQNEINRDIRGHCNIIHYETGFKADIYFAGNDKFQHWAIENAKEISFSGSKIMIAPPEYVIIKKLEFFKEGQSQKHLTDIKSILNNSKEMINFDLLNNLILKYGLKKEWEEVADVL